MRFIIVTGMSGAGKSSVLKMLEDAGYFCVDNLPISFVTKFAQLMFQKGREYDKAALGLDIRSGQALEELGAVLRELNDLGYIYEVLFLDAGTDALVKRYKETRRMHPLSGTDRIETGIEEERRKLNFLKEKADYIIDTSRLLMRELKAEIDKLLLQNQTYKNFFVTILSFGFKNGIPTDSDLVFDVRFLPNPYYVPELRPLTGNDPSVFNYVISSQLAMDFLNRLEEMLLFLIPNYILEGKNQLVVSIGCTGGKHRSVTLANAIGQKIAKTGYGYKVEHRDIGKDSIIKG